MNSNSIFTVIRYGSKLYEEREAFFVRETSVHIDSYQFGSLVVDGTTYNSDCLIFSGSVHPDWWRKRGHLLAVEDLQAVIATGPSILVVGCGASGMMKVPEEIKQALQKQNIELITTKTAEAVDRFNELVEKGENVAAALHLTC